MSELSGNYHYRRVDTTNVRSNCDRMGRLVAVAGGPSEGGNYAQFRNRLDFPCSAIRVKPVGWPQIQTERGADAG